VDLREFWDRFQRGGIEVAVGSGEPHKLLGCREAFLRVFEKGLTRPISLAVVPHEEVEQRSALPMCDEEAVTAARAAVLRLEESLGNEYHFYVGNEGGLHAVELDGEPTRYFVRSWTVIRSPVGEAWGASGSLQIPGHLIEDVSGERRSLSMAGRRRSGGMIATLTGGLENRRSAVSLATVHALSSLLHELL